MVILSSFSRTTGTYRALFTVLLAALAYQCTVESAADRILTRAGTMIGVQQLEAAPDMRIDGYDADLVPISWLGVTSNGTVAVFQSQDRVVRFFDGFGASLARVGGDGEGPGEFRHLIRGGWVADTLWVSDLRLRRITLISSAGAFVRTLPPLSAARPLPQDSVTLPDFPFVFPYALYAGDSVLMLGLPAASDPRAANVDGSALLMVSADGWIGRLVTVVPASGSVVLNLPDGGVASAAIPFFPRPLWAVSPDGEVLAMVTTRLDDGSGVVTVRCVPIRGGTSVTTEIPFEGVPIPSHVPDSILAARAEEAPIPELRRAYANDVRALVPSIYPPVEEVVVGNDHRIWLGLRAEADGRSWLVIDAAGSPEALVSLPPTSSIAAGDGEAIWVVESDQNDVESIVRYALRSRG